jgi:hypothetical protein
MGPTISTSSPLTSKKKSPRKASPDGVRQSLASKSIKGADNPPRFQSSPSSASSTSLRSFLAAFALPLPVTHSLSPNPIIQLPAFKMHCSFSTTVLAAFSVLSVASSSPIDARDVCGAAPVGTVTQTPLLQPTGISEFLPACVSEGNH